MEPEPSPQRTQLQAASLLLILLFTLYFGFFVLVLLDEAVFKTYFFVNYAPDGTEEMFQKIYAPFIAIVRYLADLFS